MHNIDYADFDDEVRPHIASYVRDVIATKRAYFPETFTTFWPLTLHYWNHRQALYIALIRLGENPETAEHWGLTSEEVDEYIRIRNDAGFTKFADPLDDIDIRCQVGWHGILRRMMLELHEAGLKVSGLVAEERNGHLAVDYNTQETFVDVARIMLLAECRSYYTCEVCGHPGEHRGEGPIWRKTRCEEHQSNDPGRLIYDHQRTPWRQMSDGRWAYDPVADTLICVPEISPA